MAPSGPQHQPIASAMILQTKPNEDKSKRINTDACIRIHGARCVIAALTAESRSRKVSPSALSKIGFVLLSKNNKPCIEVYPRRRRPGNSATDGPSSAANVNDTKAKAASSATYPIQGKTVRSFVVQGRVGSVMKGANSTSPQQKHMAASLPNLPAAPSTKTYHDCLAESKLGYQAGEHPTPSFESPDLGAPRTRPHPRQPHIWNAPLETFPTEFQEPNQEIPHQVTPLSSDKTKLACKKSSAAQAQKRSAGRNVTEEDRISTAARVQKHPLKKKSTEDDREEMRARDRRRRISRQEIKRLTYKNANAKKNLDPIDQSIINDNVRKYRTQLLKERKISNLSLHTPIAIDEEIEFVRSVLNKEAGEIAKVHRQIRSAKRGVKRQKK